MGHPHQSGWSRAALNARNLNASRRSELKTEDQPALLMFEWKSECGASMFPGKSKLKIQPSIKFEKLQKYLKESE